MKLYEWQKILLFVTNAIMKNENKIVVVLPDEQHKDDFYKRTKKILSYNPAAVSSYNDSNCIIEFKNGSVITYLTPKPESENIRGKRSEIKHQLYNWEYEIPQDVINEVIKPYEIKKDK